MAENFQHHHNWSELQWAQELRRDERRISCYLHELVHCLDLPEENTLIYDQLASTADLVPTAEAAAALHNWFFSEDITGDGDNDEFEECDGTPPLPAPAGNAENLAVKWNIFCAAKVPATSILETLAISCAFARLFARISDFTAADEPAPEALLITLGKCALRDLNQLAGMLNRFSAAHSDLAAETGSFLTRTGEIREFILARLAVLQHR